ncbi:7566_t:CDS:2, partial [Entrophospora sp. SA101]
MTYYNSCVNAASERKLDGNKITVSDTELEKQNQKNIISIAERNQERGKKIQEQKRNLETFDWDKDYVPYGHSVQEKIKAKEFEPTFAKYIFDFEKIIKCLACDAFPKYSPTGLCQYHHALAVLQYNNGLLNMLEISSIAERNQERGKKIQEQKRNLETFDWDKDYVPYGRSVQEKIKAKEFEPTFAKYIFDFEKIIKCLACDAFPKYSPTGLCQYHDFCLKFGYHHEFPNNQYTPPSQDLKANPPTSYDVLTKVFKYQKFQESQEMAISEYVNGNHTFEIDAHAILENLCISPSDVTFVRGISFSRPELKIEVHSKSTKEKLIREIIMLLKELEDGKCPTVHVCDNVYELLCEKADLDMNMAVYYSSLVQAKPVSKVNLMSDVLKMVEVSEEVVNKLNKNGKIATPKDIIQVYCQLKCDHEELTLLNTYKDKTFKQERLIKTKAEALHLLDLLIIRKIVK